MIKSVIKLFGTGCQKENIYVSRFSLTGLVSQVKWVNFACDDRIKIF